MVDKLLHCCFSEASVTLIKKIPSEVFSNEIEQICFVYFQEFVKTYGTKPSKGTYKTFLSTKTIPEIILPEVEAVYIPLFNLFEDSPEYYRSVLIKELTKRVMLNSMRNTAKYIHEDLEKAEREAASMMSIISSFDEDEEVERFGVFDENFLDVSGTQMHPSPYKTLNALTEDGGFGSPQLLVVAGAYKTNKTTFCINFGIDYAFMGLGVLFVDTENGVRNIKKRVRQRIAEQPHTAFKNGGVVFNGMTADECYYSSLKTLKRLGGDINFISVPADVYDLTQVDNEVAKLRSEGKKVDLVIYDYLEQYMALDRKLVDEKRISAVYKHAIRLNKKYSIFSLTPSHINAYAIKQKKSGDSFGGEGLAGALSKSSHAHAIFELSYVERDDWQLYGLLSKDCLIMSVIAQREGVRHGQVGFSMDLSIQKIQEILKTEVDDK